MTSHLHSAVERSGHVFAVGGGGLLWTNQPTHFPSPTRQEVRVPEGFIR